MFLAYFCPAAASSPQLQQVFRFEKNLGRFAEECMCGWALYL
jgi:hypothetical protein